MAYIAAGLVHAVIIGALLVNFTRKSETIDAAYAEKVDVVKATTIDESQIKKQQDQLKQQDLDKLRKQQQEEKNLEKLKQQSDLEKKRIKELQQQQKTEREKAVELERQRKVIALKKQQEDELRLQQELDRKRIEKQAAEKKQQQQAQERIKREQQELEAQQRMNDLLAEEEAFIADQKAKQRTTTLLQKYAALIKDRVDSFRTIAPDFERWRVAVVNIKLSPRGEVVKTSIVKSSGSERYDRSVESAILKASPLPMPDPIQDPDANNTLRDINYTFPMPGAQ